MQQHFLAFEGVLQLTPFFLQVTSAACLAATESHHCLRASGEPPSEGEVKGKKKKNIFQLPGKAGFCSFCDPPPSTASFPYSPPSPGYHTSHLTLTLLPARPTFAAAIITNTRAAPRSRISQFLAHQLILLAEVEGGNQAALGIKRVALGDFCFSVLARFLLWYLLVPRSSHPPPRLPAYCFAHLSHAKTRLPPLSDTELSLSRRFPAAASTRTTQTRTTR